MFGGDTTDHKTSQLPGEFFTAIRAVVSRFNKTIVIGFVDLQCLQWPTIRVKMGIRFVKNTICIPGEESDDYYNSVRKIEENQSTFLSVFINTFF